MSTHKHIFASPIALLLPASAMLCACAHDARPAPAPAAAPAPALSPEERGYLSLFNGKDLTGWGYANAPAFDGLTESPEKRFSVIDGLLTAHPRTPQQRALLLTTTANFTGDFILQLEFRASVRADSGIFVREHQLQCRDYSTVGPYTTLTKYKPQDWNQIVITVKGPTALCTCNGEILETAMPVPPTGGIGLESDAGTVEYRNIRLKPLP